MRWKAVGDSKYSKYSKSIKTNIKHIINVKNDAENKP